ncbi:MAG: DEAD/DEAH box helicase [Deltaproteobacteria bacterium HGW-Deltaproteobacteria-14]|nr:MAG: DEAD/DEAH box helicase [Deltaproteobacteria bacterium HGW-Deltaproteobacteria-14]
MPELLSAVAATGYTHPTPIQAQAIPPLLAGRDLLGIAQTGTGKTAAFSLPLLQHLATNKKSRRAKRTRALVLTPTRELAIQIDESFATYGADLSLRHTVIFGGVNQKPQVRAMASGVDVLVATPGRLLDLIGQGFIELQDVEVFILDEADRMLDMGFIHDVKRVIKDLPRQRQTLLFSATMPSAIVSLSRTLMHEPVRVEVTPAATTVERVMQAVMFVDKADKNELLADLFADSDLTRTLVFSRTKHGANRITEFLGKIGVSSAALHGNKSQAARQRALAAFSEGSVRALVATDIAARGIDVDGVSHVINFDLPNEPESYVHRIGRTARAGREGVALSFCMRDEFDYLRDIERLIQEPLPVLVDQPFHAEGIASDYRAGVRGSVKQGGRTGGGRNGGGGGRGRSGGGGGGGRSGGGGGGGNAPRRFGRGGR